MKKIIIALVILLAMNIIQCKPITADFNREELSIDFILPTVGTLKNNVHSSLKDPDEVEIDITEDGKVETHRFLYFNDDAELTIIFKNDKVLSVNYIK